MEIDFDSSTCAWQLVSTFGRLWRRLLWLRNEKKKKKKKKLFTFCCITIFTEFEPPHRLMIQPLSLSSFNQVLPYFCLLLPTWCVIGVSLPCFSHIPAIDITNKQTFKISRHIDVDWYLREIYISNRNRFKKSVFFFFFFFFLWCCLIALTHTVVSSVFHRSIEIESSKKHERITASFSRFFSPEGLLHLSLSR